MASPSDIAIATALARTTRAFSTSSPQPSRKNARPSEDGQHFERAIFDALQSAYPWEHCCGPDHFDMALDLTGKTGTHYEFDGAFLTHDSLYIIEAKRVSVLSRAHIGIFVQKLFDVFLAPHEHLGSVSVKPVIVSAGSKVSLAAWLHAIAWGVLLVTPQRSTPLEILGAVQARLSQPLGGTLAADCDPLIMHLWRPFNQLVRPAAPQSILYQVVSDRIYDLDTCHELLESWNECCLRASLLVPVSAPEQRV